MTTVDGGTAGRLPAVLPRALAAAQALIEAEQISYPELFGVLHYLNEVGAAGEMVLLSDVLGLSTFAERRDAAGQAGTASNVEGPFWRPGAPRFASPAVLAPPGEPGDLLLLTGTITDAGSGAPLPGAELDLWQTNSAGHYDQEDANLPEWHLRGIVVADSAGRYAVTTVKPLAYQVPTGGPVGRLLALLGRHPWRPSHTHLKVTAPGHATLTTMAYYANDPWLHDDTIGSVKPELVLDPKPDAAGTWHATFDLALRPG
ncbi:MAG TPA: dioxygenase [Mycobacteriales bacterium]|nr:dioxygenase [Mycobacteriales bacterium]